MLHTYTVYGITIGADFEFPELIPSGAEPSAFVRCGAVPLPCPVEGEGRDAYCLNVQGDEIVLRWRAVGTLLVRGGRELILDSTGSMDDRLARLFVLGAGLGMLMYQRNLLTLHASVVAVGHVAAAFLGASGLGKSTMAAALHTLGHHLVSDDLAVVCRSQEGTPVVQPGFPTMRLTPATVTGVLKEPVESSPTIHFWSSKRARRVAGPFPKGPLPLSKLFFLGTGGETEIQRLTPKDGLYLLMSHNYARRLLADRFVFSAQMQLCAALAVTAECHVLRVKRELADVMTAAELVEQFCLGSLRPGCREEMECAQS